MAKEPQRDLGWSAPMTNSKRKSALREYGKRFRSPYPRSPRHGKHAFVQGDPNTAEHNR